MSGASHYDEIRQSVIVFDPIDMVNNFTGAERPSEFIFHLQNVFAFILPGGHALKDVAGLSVLAALPGVMLRAEPVNMLVGASARAIFSSGYATLMASVADSLAVNGLNGIELLVSLFVACPMSVLSHSVPNASGYGNPVFRNFGRFHTVHRTL